MAGTYWIQTANGRRFYYDDMRPEQFFIDDIAAGLSRNCRYNGQLKNTPELEDEIYSVAQHSVYVYRLLKLNTEAPDRALPWALLHDGPEGYLTDMPSPQKALCPDYQEMEGAAEESFLTTYTIPYDEEVHRWVKWADIQLLWMESQEMCAIPCELWDDPGNPIMSIRELDPDFYYWRPKKAKQEYLAAFEEIQQYLANENGVPNAYAS